MGDGTITADSAHTYSADSVYTLRQIVYNACKTDTSYTQLVVGFGDIEILRFPEVFTPNFDGINDVWKIKNIEYFPDNELIILNRWGNQVYYTQSYQNDWGGISSGGQPLNRGTYLYVLRVRTNRPGEKDKIIRDTVTIVR